MSMSGKSLSVTVGCVALGLLASGAGAETVEVLFEADGYLVRVARPVPEREIPAAVLALVAGPTTQEAEAGIYSHIPAGVEVVDVKLSGDTVSVDLSPEVLTGFDEAALADMFRQFRATLGDFPEILSIRLTCRGRLLSTYLEPAQVDVVPLPPPAAFLEPEVTGLSGTSVTIGPSHGRYWNGSGWYWQRSDPCVYGEAVLEDTNSIRLMQFLNQYLAQDGATVHVCRELDESNCCHGDTGLHWWKMAARYWLEHIGVPSWVWDSSTTHYNDDIRARPLYSDYVGSNIYVSCHTNAGGGTGTETYRDTAMEHPEHETNSYNLALAVHNNAIDAIRDMYDGGWTNRGVKDSNGGFGEIRIPNRPACLIELAFHDKCDRDAQYLTDNFFRSVAEWGVYKGICQYFGRTPGWDKYSDEYVSDTIPSSMNAGQSYNVSVTFRNRGVLWTTARSFRLGAVDDSDPFTSFNRVDISGEVRPGSEYTFNFTMTAPVGAGTYTTDWRMVRDGVTWFGATHTEQVTVTGGGPSDHAQYISDTIPGNMTPGQTIQVDVTFKNNGTTTWTKAAGYKLGAVGDSDPFAATRHELNEGESISPGSQRTFTFTFTAPGTADTYTTDWRMLQDGGAGWFGDTLTKNVAVSGGSLPPGSWTHDSGEFYPDDRPDWARRGDLCAGYTVYYRTARYGGADEYFCNWDPGWDFRGRFKFDTIIPCNYAWEGTRYRFNRHGYSWNGNNPDTNRKFSKDLDQCAYGGWITIDERNWDGDRVGSCNIGSNDTWHTCGDPSHWHVVGASKGRWYGCKWYYINDWVCLGGYSGSLTDNATGWDEADIYLYPAVDTSHGNVFAYNGEVPGRVTTGDCNWQNSLNFKGNASAYGNCDNCYSYGFAWMYSPGGCGPKWLIGSDDGNRLWVNGSLRNDNDASRGLTRDDDETGGYGWSAGWGRVLFKVRNGTGGFEGTVSLRNGGTRDWNEPSVQVFDLGGYYSYGLGCEQDGWYPGIDVASFYGSNNPGPNSDHYGNDTTVSVSGTAWANGPVPLWKVMHFEWGYGLSGDTDYTDVSSSGSSWSHTHSGVTGHRRFHFFAVSKSRRTSFQDSGATGGWNWADGGPANYMDVYVDNAPPQNPTFSSVSAASTGQINLNWSIPLDEGVGVGAGSTEYASEGGDNAYRRGDVGVYVRRSGSGIYGWGTWTSCSDTGLSANTQYTYTIEARDNSSGGRGGWNNATGQQDSTTRFTLIESPTGLTCANVTTDSIDAALAGSFSNLTSGSSGTYLENTTAATNSGWRQHNNAWSNSGLSANKQYSFSVKARNGDGVETSTVSNSAWTLSQPPTPGSVGPDTTDPCPGDDVNWTAVGGFGEGKIEYYRYAWDQSPTHTWTGSETQWSGGTIATTPTAPGDWYLHVQGYNGADVANGTYSYSVTALELVSVAADPADQASPEGGTATFTVTASGVNLIYQWYDSGGPLSNGSRISGADTATLEIADVDASDVAAGPYHCQVSGDCGDPAASGSASLMLISWQSVRSHDGFGELAIDLEPDEGNDPMSEPRRYGIQKITVQFTETVAAADGSLDVNDVVVTDSESQSYVPHSVSLVGGDLALVVEFEAGDLPDGKCYTFELAGKFKKSGASVALGGNMNCEVRGLVGDVNNDGNTDLIDMGRVKSKNRLSAAESPADDVNLSGSVNLVDMALVKSLNGNSAPCP